MSSIFISYRRTGTSGYCGLLQDGLRDHFGRDRVFRDIDSIRPGADFTEVVEKAVSEAGVVLALIGSNWLDARNEAGGRRLDDPDDFVRLEIESALKHGIVVVPVLVEGAKVPSERELPPSISRLGRSQAIALSDERWEYDLNRLVTALEELVGAPSGTSSETASPGPNHPTDSGTAVAAATPAAPRADGSAAGPAPHRPPQRGLARPAGNRVLMGSAVGIGVLLLAIGFLVGTSGSGDQGPDAGEPTTLGATLTLEELGELGDNGDEEAQATLDELAGEAGLDPDDYPTWADLAAALSEATEGGGADEPTVAAAPGTATVIDCAEEGAVRSGDGGTDTTITFVNSTADPVDVYWLNHDGDRELYHEGLAAGSSQEQETFVGDYWLAADPTGGCLGIYQGQGTSSLADIP